MLSVALVSVNGAGTASGNSSSLFGDPGASGASSLPPGQASATLSKDGSLMVFQSDATDLVAGVSDTNQATDVFVRNLTTGQTTLVSATPDGSVGNGRSFDPVISPNGRYVAFLSTATNLSTTAANPPGSSAADGTGLLYVRDLQTGTTTLLDATPDGQAANGLASAGFVFSPDSTDAGLRRQLDQPDQHAAPRQHVWRRRPITSISATSPRGRPRPSASRRGARSPRATPRRLPGNSDLVFSPDGTRLAFVSTATDLDQRLGGHDAGARHEPVRQRSLGRHDHAGQRDSRRTDRRR